MSNEIVVVSVNTSEAKGTVKHPAGEILIDSLGVSGDAHAGPWHRQVSILSQELVDEFSATHNRPVNPGEFGENVTVRGLNTSAVGLLDRLCIGEAELEITQIGKACHGSKCAISREIGECIMPTRGLFARVIRGGKVREGDRGTFSPKVLRIGVITLSERAAAGLYEDESGPLICSALEEFFREKRWHPEIECCILPDDERQLIERIEATRRNEADIIITNGSTGVGPRDIAPDVIAPLCDKLIPGIMEHVRIKYGSSKPGALLSRGVAGVMGHTLVFTLPGSPRAVREYMGEIFHVLEHLIFMVHGIDRHG